MGEFFSIWYNQKVEKSKIERINVEENKVKVGIAELRIDIPWVQSLKEKRMIAKSIIAKTKNMFGVSIAETAEQDTLKTLVLGIAAVGNNAAFVLTVLEKTIGYIQSITEGDVVVLQKEWL